MKPPRFQTAKISLYQLVAFEKLIYIMNSSLRVTVALFSSFRYNYFFHNRVELIMLFLNQFLSEYSIFLAKTATIVIAIIIVFTALIALKIKAKSQNKGSLQIEKLNEKYEDIQSEINNIIQTKVEKKARKTMGKKSEKEKKAHEKSDTPPSRLFILNFTGDIQASAVSSLREEITAILLTAKSSDEVLIRLESAGGVVHGYGLAASQLQRLKNAKIPLTVSIDKVAASGGYMMACVADKIIAAPFAIIGSIGVIAQLPNVHRLLQKNNIDFEQITAGEYKRTLTIFGENTKAGREKLQEEVNEMHALFKNFVKTNRTIVPIETVATGEHWFAMQTLDKKLIDQLQTSDDYLMQKKDHFDLYEMTYKIKQPLSKRIMERMQNNFLKLFSVKNKFYA